MEVEAKNSDPWWIQKPISDMAESMSPLKNNIIDSCLTIDETIKIMKSRSIETALVFKDG